MPGEMTYDTPAAKHGRVKAGHLPVSEMLFDRPGAPSPFGEDVTFPVASETLTYRQPETADQTEQS